MKNYLLMSLAFFSFSVNAVDISVTLENNRCTALVLDKHYSCSLGANGISKNKVEGDKTTPIGKFKLREILYREDRIDLSNLVTNLPKKAITTDDGWCDDSNSPRYNRLISLKTFDSKFSYEKLYRNDDVYDLIIVVGYNDNPIIKGKGSAIFIHFIGDKNSTAGCIAFSRQDLMEIVTSLNRDSRIIISSGSNST